MADSAGYCRANSAFGAGRAAFLSGGMGDPRRSGSHRRCSLAKANPIYLVKESVNIAVQFNGKLRTTVTMAPDLTAAEVESQVRRDSKVAALLAGTNLKKTIVIPNRIVNFGPLNSRF